jgi:hypothetical protein
MKAEEIAKWVVDNRYNCTTISDEEMYKLVLNEINLNFKSVYKNKVSCSTCKYLSVECNICDSCYAYDNYLPK